MEDISIWLLPSEETKKDISVVINDLASKYNSSFFLPHITAYYLANSIKFETVLSIVQEVSKRVRPFRLLMDTVAFGDTFSKTLFARYFSSPEFETLYGMFRKEFYSVYPYELNPHMSLLYKLNMDQNKRQDESKVINIPKKIILDSIAIITKPGSGIASEKDVLDWVVRFETPLGS